MTDINGHVTGGAGNARNHVALRARNQDAYGSAYTDLRGGRHKRVVGFCAASMFDVEANRADLQDDLRTRCIKRADLDARVLSDRYS